MLPFIPLPATSNPDLGLVGSDATMPASGNGDVFEEMLTNSAQNRMSSEPDEDGVEQPEHVVPADTDVTETAEETATTGEEIEELVVATVDTAAPVLRSKAAQQPAQALGAPDTKPTKVLHQQPHLNGLQSSVPKGSTVQDGSFLAGVTIPSQHPDGKAVASSAADQLISENIPVKEALPQHKTPPSINAMSAHLSPSQSLDDLDLRPGALEIASGKTTQPLTNSPTQIATVPQTKVPTREKQFVEQQLANVRVQKIENAPSQGSAISKVSPKTMAYGTATTTLKQPQTTTVAPTDTIRFLHSDAVEPLIRFEPGTALERVVSLQPGVPPQTLPDQVRQIAQQMATAMPTTLPGTTEITLQPEELGRVRMILTLQDGAMTMVIQAERAETSDLMRRHIDQLALTYRQMGFETLNFSFTGSAQQERSEPVTDPDMQLFEENDPSATSPLPEIERAATDADGRLDLRF